MGKDVERTGRRLMSVIPPFARIVGGSDATDVNMETFVSWYGLQVTAVRGKNLSKHRVVRH